MAWHRLVAQAPRQPPAGLRSSAEASPSAGAELRKCTGVATCSLPLYTTEEGAGQYIAFLDVPFASGSASPRVSASERGTCLVCDVSCMCTVHDVT